MSYSSIPIHKDIIVSKRRLRRLPRSFEETSLGYSREGALTHYRGPGGVHVHEHPRYWSIHRDMGDPRTVEGIFAHLIEDAPEIPLSVAVGGILGAITGKIVYETRKQVSEDAKTEAIIVGAFACLIFGLTTYFLTKA